MDRFYEIGDKIALTSLALSIGYIAKRKAYTNMYTGKTGTVIGYSGTGKVAVEFDTTVFHKHNIKLSSHDNGCHSKGKLHYCWYIPEECLIGIVALKTEDLLLLLL